MNKINIEDKFLNIQFTPSHLDIYLVRTSILKALKNSLNLFSGTLLDIGCGYMPYKNFILENSRVEKYIGLDFKQEKLGIYQQPELEWDGNNFPLEDNAVNCALATEVFEHCPEPEIVMKEAFRVLKPNGVLFFTVPFLWPLHDVPYDEYRYTPFALRRHLTNSGFKDITLTAMGGWDASLAQMIGLWVRRRPISSQFKGILSFLALPIVWFLIKKDTPPKEFWGNAMMTGISGIAIKAEDI